MRWFIKAAIERKFFHKQNKYYPGVLQEMNYYDAARTQGGAAVVPLFLFFFCGGAEYLLLHP
jgi:hypothetical protein